MLLVLFPLKNCYKICIQTGHIQLWKHNEQTAISQKSMLKLQALVYDILPSTTAVFSYAIGSRKLSANEQFFVGAQTVVSLLQTIQIKQGISYSRQQSLHQHK